MKYKSKIENEVEYETNFKDLKMKLKLKDLEQNEK